IRTAYLRSIEYSLTTLISYVETYGDKNLVMVFLGDHQPAPVVSGSGASRDVPVTIVAQDPSVFDRISSWGWQDGLRPDPPAPVKVTVTARGDLDPAAAFFCAGAVDKLVYCASPAVVKARDRLAGVATVVDAGDPVDLPGVLADLAARGTGRLMVEGGSSI